MAKAKKRAAKVNTTKSEPVVKPVRLVLPEADHERLERCASRIGLSMSSCARMAVLRWIEAEEERRGEPR